MMKYWQKIRYITSGVAFWVTARYSFTRRLVAKYYRMKYNKPDPIDLEDLIHLNRDGPVTYFITGKPK